MIKKNGEWTLVATTDGPELLDITYQFAFDVPDATVTPVPPNIGLR